MYIIIYAFKKWKHFVNSVNFLFFLVGRLKWKYSLLCMIDLAI